ncbi:hypothetical protein Vadar_016936 [Vaccinium darrowii]|uniref:Uncharacterized protein n=1 Tax=Vaccinium darrowii TaxID=229202 RepID=A0ACB7X4Y5_9ERIC|nr:hypothetical protein Vadar_030293 [Vaccinium darrowii]KAH7856280.1 hypothetical protein Vadar_016936 [Vaccinium darrowii]
MQPQPATNQPYPPPTPSHPQSDTPSPPQSDTPSPQSVEQSPQVTGAGTSSSTRKRCPTQGFASSWKFVDPLIKAAILQSNQDKFDNQDGIEGNPLANVVSNKKASLLYKDWKCRMRTHYRKLRKAGLDTYSSPYPGVSMDGWKYLIDHVFKDSKMKRWRAGRKNRKKLPHNHTMGSRSFPAVISIEAKENGNKPFDFCAFFKRSHTRKNKQRIKPSCEVQHAEMVKVRDEAK